MEIPKKSKNSKNKGSSFHLRYQHLNKTFIDLAFKPERNKLLNIIPVKTKEWQMSLEFIVYGQHNEEFTDILRCSTPGNGNKPIGGSRLPAIAFYGNKKVRLNVWNEYEVVKDYQVNYNQWYKVDINLKRVSRVDVNYFFDFVL